MSSSTNAGGGIVGKLIFTGFGLFFAFFGAQFVKQEWKAGQEIQAMQQWMPSSGIIESSTVEDAGEDFRLVVTYRYEVDGTTYTGDRYGRKKNLVAETIGEIKSAEKKWPQGKTIDLYYNPTDPAEAVLDLPTVGNARTGFLFTLLFPAFGLFFASLPWLRGRNKDREKKKERSPKFFLIPFGAIFALIGLLMLKPLLFQPLEKTRDAKTWNEVPAEVVSSKVKSHQGDDSTTYSPYIAYRYEINGEEFFGDQFSFMGGSSSGYDRKAEIVRQYPKGHQFTIYVNPNNPADAVISRAASAALLFGLMPLIFVAVGIVVIVAGFRIGKGSKAKLDDRQAQEHVVELKGKSPVAKAIGITIFACIWNGGVFLIFKSDAPILFRIIFGFFGIAILLGAVHSILALFNPRPAVEMTPGNIVPGTSIALRWRMSGSPDRIGKLTITLQRLKITTETRRSGSETRTTVVKTPEYEQELQQIETPAEIAQGTLQFVIPGDQPASRPGNSNGIQWQIVFHGDIVRWPDLKQELPFTVYPKA